MMEATAHTVLAFKNLSYVVAFLAALEWLNLDGTGVAILGVLLIVDFFTGVLRAGLVEGGRAIKSNIAIRGFVAKMLVITIPFVLALAGKGVGVEMSAIATASITVFTLSTVYSILGNIHSISTGKPKQEFDAIEYINEQVRNLLKRVIDDDDV